MGEVSGFVFNWKDESIYLAGDTIWCKEVEDSLATFNPAITILNAGGARFLTGDPITMNPTDVITVKEKFPETEIIAVHMDTVNHCFDKRANLRQALSDKKITSVLIPMDGETIKV
jgi:L-ascorbate metabolism protein UlaG (beta-lactamase superfamily)